MTLAAVVDACPTGVLVVRADGRLVQVNTAARQLLGLDANRLLLAYSGDYLQLRGRLEQVVQLGSTTPVSVVQRVMRSDGRPLWVEFRMQLLPATVSDEPLIVVFLTDRTRQQLQERTIRAQVAGLDLALSQANVAVVVTDGANRVVRWSPGAEQLFGIGEDAVELARLPELIGVAAAELDPLIERASTGEVVRGATVRRTGAGAQADQQLSVSVALAATDEFGGQRSDGLDAARYAWVLLSPEQEATGTALRANERRLRKILQNINDTITIIDVDGETISASGQFALEPVLGYSQQAWEQGLNMFELIHPDDQPWIGQQMVDLLEAPGRRTTGLIRIRAADGSYINAEGWAVNLLEDPDVAGILVTTRNVSERIRNEAFVSGQAEILRQVASSAPLELTMRRLAELVSGQLDGAVASLVQMPAGGGESRAFGPTPFPTPLRRLACLPIGADGPVVLGDDADELPPQGRDALRAMGRRTAILTAVVAAGATSTGGHPTQLGTLISLLEARREPTPRELEVLSAAADLAAIAIEREQSERDLAHQALHDELTGLANRHLLQDRLEQAHNRVARRGGRLALLFLDLDRFKTVNDALGHEVGDELLQEFAGRLRRVVRPEDTVARFGGDEFVVLVEQVVDDQEIAHIAERLEHLMSEPFHLAGQPLAVTVSVGIVVADGEESPATLLRNADSAMYRAKELGRNRTEIFDRDLEAHLADRTQLSIELRDALANGHLGLAYAPVIDLRDGRLVMVEAQLRWDHPQHGRLMPVDFLAVAEDSGQSLELGAWMIERGLNDLAALVGNPAWTAADGPGRPPQLSIRLSNRQLAHPELVSRLDQALSRHRFPAGCLSIDVPERILTAAGELLVRNLQELRGIGIGIGIGDVGGTPNSALLSTLSRVRIDLLKIDHSVVATLRGTRPDSARVAPPEHSLVGGLIGLGHGLGLAVAAHGVDSALWLQELRQLGCDLAQGGVIGAPVDAGRLVSLLR